MIKNGPKVEEKTVRPLRTRGQKRGTRGSKKGEAGVKPPQIGTTWSDFFKFWGLYLTIFTTLTYTTFHFYCNKTIKDGDIAP